MEIKLSNHIFERTCNTNSDPASISFITDLKDFKEYALTGKLSLLWEYIVKSGDFDLIRNFALVNHLDDILIDFLSELKDKNIIDTELQFPKHKLNLLNHAITPNSENYKYYKISKTQFFKKNNLIEILTLILTYKCNLYCKHCCSPKDNNIEMSFDQAKDIIDNTYELGINDVSLTGGECLINKDFLKIAQYVREKHLNLLICSNGQKLYDDEKLFNQILELNPISIQLSLYSINPDIHDNMTGVKGSHHKTLSVIKNLKEHNINVSIANFLSIYNKESSNELKEYAKSLNIGYTESCLFINNTDNNNLKAKLNANDLVNYYSKYLEYSSKYKKFKKNDDFICTAGITRIAITPNLDIIPCPYSKYIFGNFNTTSIKELKENILPEYRNKFRSCNLTECFKFDYCKYCTYCSTIATLNEGFMKKSEILCENSKAVQNAFEKNTMLQNK